MKRRWLPAARTALGALYRHSVPVSVRDAWTVHRELRRREREPVVGMPPRGVRVLVLSPHMDDEVFGCGGTLARAVDAGSEVRVVFMTDGRRGYDPRRVEGWPRAAVERHERQLAGDRKAEAGRAGAVLGFAPPLFLDLPDGGLAQARHAAEMLSGVLRELRPGIVFLPFLTDPHPDHAATSRIFLEACASGALPERTPCWGYEVWSPLVANMLIDVGEAMARKRSAMRAYASQILDVDYPRAIEGLNAYRALAAGCSQGYAEAFYVATCARYRELLESMSGRAHAVAPASLAGWAPGES